MHLYTQQQAVYFKAVPGWNTLDLFLAAGYSVCMQGNDLQKLSALIRYQILSMTTRAGSGHPTSSLSATDLMTALWFGGSYHFDFDHPENSTNDRLIFSKGHASPLYYALFFAAGIVTEKEMEGYRTFDSNLEGHPTPRFKYTEAATGSLGQGLSVGIGMALATRQVILSEAKNPDSMMKAGRDPSSPSTPQDDKQVPTVYVLLGDGEMAEGSVWEAAEIASHYELDNLVAIVDVNRLGQSQETMLGWDIDTYRDRLIAFGWETTVINGHDYQQIANALEEARLQKGRKKPFAIIAKTKKGKGVAVLENKDNWHGKPLPQNLLEEALKELGDVDQSVRGTVEKPVEATSFANDVVELGEAMHVYPIGEAVATRKAYGTALARLGYIHPKIVALDAEVKNSTYAEDFKKAHPDRFFEMYIAEQNMVGCAIGFARRGYIPFVSTFAAFFTRAFDQMRMAALSGAAVRFVGSHVGVSIGEDGPSQMGLEDIAMFRSVHGATILYPSDALSTEKLVEAMVALDGISYLRTSRPTLPVLYGPEEPFPVGGFKVHTSSLAEEKGKKKVLIIAAGVTLHEALTAQLGLAKDDIAATVVDLYSIRPVDGRGLQDLVETEKITQVITVEDHWIDGGIGDVILNVFNGKKNVTVTKLAIVDMPRSGKPAQLLAWAGIDAASIQKTVNGVRMRL